MNVLQKSAEIPRYALMLIGLYFVVMSFFNAFPDNNVLKHLEAYNVGAGGNWFFVTFKLIPAMLVMIPKVQFFAAVVMGLVLLLEFAVRQDPGDNIWVMLRPFVISVDCFVCSMVMARAEYEVKNMIEVRLATPDESPEISSLIIEAFSPFRPVYTDGAFEFTTPPADEVRERFAEGPIWLAIDGDEVVGTVSGLPEDGRFYIRSMAVKPTAQGRGVGQTLLAALEEYARNNGFAKLFLYTTYVLPGAKPLYEKNGFYVLRETAPEEWYDMGGFEMEKVID